LLSVAVAIALASTACSNVSAFETAGAPSPDEDSGVARPESRDVVLPRAQSAQDNTLAEATPASWTAEPAVVQEEAWIDWVGSTGSETGWWHGGDGNEAIQLPDGRVWHFFADTYNGLVDPDFSRGSASHNLVYNSIVIRGADGQFLGQVWDEQISEGPPGSSPAIVPDQDKYPGNFYWLPAGAVLEDGELRIFAALMESNPLRRVDTHILTLDANDGSVMDVTPTGLTAANFSPAGVFEHAGWLYVNGQRPSVNVEEGWGMLRAPIGTIRDLETWQAWDGRRWNDDLSAHGGIQGDDGELLPTFGVYYDFRASRYGFLALSVPLGGELTIYRADQPQGPYESVGTLPTDAVKGEDEDGGIMAAYAPRWHPHYDTEEGLTVSYATNYFGEPTMPDTELDNRYYMPHYVTVPHGMFDDVFAVDAGTGGRSDLERSRR
jgi:hypothetical protein